MSMTQSHAVKLINAQAKGITLAKAIELLQLAHPFVGRNSSVRAMDLSQVILEFTTQYRQAVEEVG